MKTIITTTLAATLFVSLLGCEKTNQDEPKTWSNAPDRLGAGAEGAAQGPINAVKATGKAIGDGAEAIGNAFSSDDDSKE